MRYRVRDHAEEFACPACGAPVYAGETAWQDGTDGPASCSAYCAGADPRTNQRPPPRPALFVADGQGCAAEVSLGGPQAGHANRAPAVAAGRRRGACCSCGRARCRCEV